MSKRTPPPCSKAHLHTTDPSEPLGYLAWHDWAERKSRRHYQVRCPGCGLYKIWRRKPLRAIPVDTQEEPEPKPLWGKDGPAEGFTFTHESGGMGLRWTGSHWEEVK